MFTRADGMPYRNRLERAQFILDWLRRHNHFGKDPSHRIARMCNRVRKQRGTIYPNGKGYDIAMMEMQDLREFEIIAEQFDGDALTALIRDRISRALADDLLPTVKGSTSGRETQFELAMGAHLSRAGLDLSGTMAERGPDWHVLGPYGIPWSMEVKRLKSPKQIGARAAEASDQLADTGRISVAVFDVSQARSPTMGAVSHTQTQEEREESRRLRYVECCQMFEQQLRPRLSCPLVGIAIVLDTERREPQDDGRPDFDGFWLQCPVAPSTSAAHAIASAIWEWVLFPCMPFDRGADPLVMASVAASF